MLTFGQWIIDFLSRFFEYIVFWVVIEQFEEGVLLRFGKYNKNLLPGWHLKWPLADYSYVTNITTDTIEIANVNVTTLDGQTISTGFVVEYIITDVKKFLIEANDSKSNIRDLAKGVVSNHLEDVNWEDIRKKTTINAIKRKLTDKYIQLGVAVKDVLFTDKCKSRAIKIFSDKTISV